MKQNIQSLSGAPIGVNNCGGHIMRAYFLEKNQMAQAKTVGARLPFSYLQRDWKKSTRAEIKQAHQSIYELDNASKNTIETQAGIDLFYTKFFLNEFGQ